MSINHQIVTDSEDSHVVFIVTTETNKRRVRKIKTDGEWMKSKGKYRKEKMQLRKLNCV